VGVVVLSEQDYNGFGKERIGQSRRVVGAAVLSEQDYNGFGKERIGQSRRAVGIVVTGATTAMNLAKNEQGNRAV